MIGLNEERLSLNAFGFGGIREGAGLGLGLGLGLRGDNGGGHDSVDDFLGEVALGEEPDGEEEQEEDEGGAEAHAGHDPEAEAEY